MSPPPQGEAPSAEMASRRRSRLSSVLAGGALSTGVLLWTLTSRLELPVPGAPGFRPLQQSKQSGDTSCECLLDLQCPRYNFQFPQEKDTYCKIHSFPFRSTKSCLQWREHHFGISTHVVLMGDLRLLYLYRYIRDELMSDSERVEGPAYCKSVHKNWTHPYLKEAGADQPPVPCRHLAINRLAKLEYIWTEDRLWPEILSKLIDRCRLGACPSMLVVSSRLDLMAREHKKGRELSMAQVSDHVSQVLPMLETLRSYGVHVWWKLHENLLDLGTTDYVAVYNEVIQQHNLKLMSTLSSSSVPVWSSTDAISWMHHHTCENTPPANWSVSPDFRCLEPYYLGNWAQKQYLDIMLNFLCGRAQPMAQNPCCVGWS